MAEKYDRVTAGETAKKTKLGQVKIHGWIMNLAFDFTNKEKITIVIPGEPVAKGRPKHRIVETGSRAFTQTYTPAKTRNYENLIKSEAAMVMAGRPPLDCRVSLKVTAYRQPLSSFSKKKREAALAQELVPTQRPDADNYLKAALDGMNGVVFRDDSLVADALVCKRYSETPRLEIEVFA